MANDTERYALFFLNFNKVCLISHHFMISCYNNFSNLKMMFFKFLFKAFSLYPCILPNYEAFTSQTHRSNKIIDRISHPYNTFICISKYNP